MITDARSRLGISDEQLEEFCRRWKIRNLELFGSVLREDFGPESDIDLLVTFEPDAHWSLFDHIHIEDELKAATGRNVDIVTMGSVLESENWLRRKAILSSARSIYARS